MSYLRRVVRPRVPGNLLLDPPVRLFFALLVAIVGVIHFSKISEYFGIAAYLGLLFVAAALGSLVCAIAVLVGSRLGVALAALISAGSMVSYVLEHTTGLPSDYVPVWFVEPRSLLLFVVEGLVVVLYVVVALAQRTLLPAPSLRRAGADPRRRRSSGSRTRANA